MQSGEPRRLVAVGHLPRPGKAQGQSSGKHPSTGCSLLFCMNWTPKRPHCCAGGGYILLREEKLFPGSLKPPTNNMEPGTGVMWAREKKLMQSKDTRGARATAGAHSCHLCSPLQEGGLPLRKAPPTTRLKAPSLGKSWKHRSPH